MNRLGMMVGVSHLSATGIFHCAEISTKPIVSTHTNLTAFIDTERQHNDEEVKAIASTGGLVGIRYIGSSTSYEFLAKQIDYMVNLVGIEHIAVGWLGHDKGHPYVGQLPDITKNPRIPTGVEAQSMYEHWNNFIGVLYEHGYTDEQISLILGGNFIRVWNEILPE